MSIGQFAGQASSAASSPLCEAASSLRSRLLSDWFRCEIMRCSLLRLIRSSKDLRGAGLLWQPARRFSDITYGADNADVDAIIEESLVRWSSQAGARWLPPLRFQQRHLTLHLCPTPANRTGTEPGLLLTPRHTGQDKPAPARR
jgi:hypothetical protein